MGAAGAVLVCQSDSQQIIAMQYIIMCLCVYICMCTLRKCSTCSFSMQLCNSPLCATQPVKHAALYSSSTKICSLCFHACGLCMLWLLLIAALNTPSTFQMVGFALDHRVPAESLHVFPWGATSSPRALLN